MYLYNFCNYLNIKELGFDDLTIEYTEDFFSSMNYTLASRHNAARNISLFLQFAYDNGKSVKDTSVFILPDSYKKDSKLPTTYEEDEIKKLVSSVVKSYAGNYGRRLRDCCQKLERWKVEKATEKRKRFRS